MAMISRVIETLWSMANLAVRVTPGLAS